MSAKVIIGPSASGKTQHCIQRIGEVLSDQPLGPVWVVVPDRYQTYAFRRKLGRDGGVIGVHVGTFGRLYSEILWAARKPIPVAPNPVVQRLIRAAVRRVESDQGLDQYAPIADMPGFQRALRSTVAELKLARVWPESFLQLATDQQPELLEIAQIYTRYQHKLSEMGWADSEGVNWLATEALELDPALFSSCPLLVVDGFDSFEGAQRAALGLLSQRLPQVLITLPGAYPMRRRAHRRFQKTLARLEEDIPLEIETLPSETRLPPVFAHLERSLFEPGRSPLDPHRQVILLEVQTPREEAREAVRWAKSRHVRTQVPLDQIAIVTPDPQRYRPYLRAAALEFGLPLRFTQGEPLSSAPGIAALLELLELPQRNFPSRLILGTIRTPYFDLSVFDLQTSDADPLESVSRHGLVIEGIEQWDEALSNLALTRPPSDHDEEEVNILDLPRGDEALRLFDALRAFITRMALPSPQNIYAWVSWLEDLLDDLGFMQEDRTSLDEAAFLGLREVLRALVLGERVAEEGEISAEAFLRTLRSFLENTYYQERHNWKDPAVLVLRVLEARGVRYHSLALLGLAEGIFPEVEREDPFLNDRVRSQLGLERRLEREQGGLLYQIVTRADRQLLLARPTMAEDGEYWEPSPYWTEIEDLLEGEPITLRRETPRPLADAASTSEFLFWQVRSQESLSPHLEGELGSRWDYVQRAAGIIQARTKKTAEGPFEGRVTALADSLRLRYGSSHLWSSSRLETYGNCPFRFYVESANELEIKEFPELGIDALQLGSMLHRILEITFQRATDPADPNQAKMILDQVIEEVFSKAPATFGFRPTHLWDVEQEQLAAALRDTLVKLEEFEPGWTPIAFEQPFGFEGHPVFEMDVGDEQVRIRGFIDRVDRNRAGELRVIDYKTGSSHLGKRDLLEGRRLQLPIYALAADEALGLGTPVEGLYWAILKGQPGSLRLSTFRPPGETPKDAGPSAAISIMKGYVKEYVSAIQEGQFPPIPPRGGCPEYCAAAAWCWRYTPSGW